mmetsp:Transcript_25338/g.72588  ORF Transcript_25338/g.72588 Transcript_25338/m.72588 type:complete len:218 (+) Transcript_25338:1040-1693(+)
MLAQPLSTLLTGGKALAQSAVANCLLARFTAAFTWRIAERTAMHWLGAGNTEGRVSLAYQRQPAAVCEAVATWPSRCHSTAALIPMPSRDASADPLSKPSISHARVVRRAASTSSSAPGASWASNAACARISLAAGLSCPAMLPEPVQIPRASGFHRCPARSCGKPSTCSGDCAEVRLIALSAAPGLKPRKTVDTAACVEVAGTPTGAISRTLTLAS